MKSIVLTLVGLFMLWMLVGCDGFLDEYSITEVRPTELTDIEQLLLGDAYLDGLLEPTAVYSNVTDGFGVVTGYQISTRRLTMPFGDRTHVWY